MTWFWTLLCPFLLHSLQRKGLCNEVKLQSSAAVKTMCVPFPVAMVCVLRFVTKVRLTS